MSSAHEKARREHARILLHEDKGLTPERAPEAFVLHNHEYPNISKTRTFREILLDTDPPRPTEVVDSILGIILAFQPYMNQDSDESLMYLRGGIARQEFFGNYYFNSDIDRMVLWEYVKDTPPPDGSLSKKVLDHITGPKDIDIELNEGNVEIDGDTVIRPFDGFMPEIIDQALTNYGWRKPRGDSEVFISQQGEYNAQVISFPIGRTVKRMMRKVVFTRNSDGSVVSEIGFADQPRSKKEIDEDIRLLPDSIDGYAVGYVHIKPNDQLPVEESILVTFDNEYRDNDLPMGLFTSQVHDRKIQPNDGFKIDYVWSLMNAFRAINMVLSDEDACRWFGGPLSRQIRGTIDDLKYTKMSQETKGKVRKLLETWAREQLPYIQEKAVPLLGDLLFTIASSPYMGMLIGYASGLFEAINLGDIIDSEEKLIQVIQYIGNIAGYFDGDDVLSEDTNRLQRLYWAACWDNTTDPLVVFEALQHISYSEEEIAYLRQQNLYPPDMERSLDNLLRFLLPRGIKYEEISSV